MVEIRHACQTREGYLILVLEYIEGGNLFQWMENERGGGPLQVAEAVTIVADLAEVLASAHALGILHRDVKPPNVLMRPLGSGRFQLKLCDFGLAIQRAEEMTRDGVATIRFGTPGYSAPEQYSMPSREQDARVDVFGMGMTLYRLVAGRLPWDASETVWPLVCEKQPRRSLRELRPELAGENWLENLLVRMTAANRADRLLTAAEVVARLKEDVSIETRRTLGGDLRIGARPRPAVTEGRDHQEEELIAGQELFSKGEYARAFKMFLPLAQRGNRIAQSRIGWMYEAGEGVPQNYGEAVKWYRQAAEQGYVRAQRNLGRMYVAGMGVRVNLDEAVKWTRRAAVQGDAAAQHNLGVMYDNGWGVSQDYKEAARWCRLAAEQGDSRAQGCLGMAYREGKGVQQDCTEALKWLHRAAEHMEPDSDSPVAALQFIIGHMYAEGQGSPSDFGEAIKWYRFAAEQGHAGAQFNLGLLYEIAALHTENTQLKTHTGVTVPEDYNEPMKWYRLAAGQGHARAQLMLGHMYADGRGAARDYVQAHLWYHLAGVGGSAEGVKCRDSIARRMTTEQIAKAEHLAHGWKPRANRGDISTDS